MTSTPIRRQLFSAVPSRQWTLRAAPTLHAQLQARPRSVHRMPFTTSTTGDAQRDTMTTPPPPAPRVDHTLRLSDGRTLSYATFGPSHGRSVFFLHGLPSCRLEAAGIASSGLLDQAGVRLIVPDRPGFGQSSPSPGRTVAGYTDDMVALVRHLGLDGMEIEHKAEATERLPGGQDGKKQVGYGIVGGSGGGPYALACAQVASRDSHRFVNLHKVGIFAGAPPFVPPTPASTTTYMTHRADTRELQKDWMISSRSVFWLAKHLPKLSRGMSLITVHAASGLYRTTWGRKLAHKSARRWLGKMMADTTETSTEFPLTITTTAEAQGSDMEATLDRETDGFIELAQETWAQGPNGWLDEVRLLGRPWGFDPSEINPEVPVKIWHGSKDANAPLRSMRWLADRIPGAELVVLEGKGHFALGGSLKEMLEWASSSQETGVGLGALK